MTSLASMVLSGRSDCKFLLHDSIHIHTLGLYAHRVSFGGGGGGGGRRIAV